MSNQEEQKSVAAQVLQDARIQREIKDDYRKVFVGSPEGRRVLTDLLQYCGVLRPIIDDDEKTTHFNAGRQSIGLRLIDLVDTSGYEAIIELEKFGAELTKIGED